MKICLQDKRVQISYSPVVREYYIKLRGSLAVQGISYCPWCGIQLPKKLRTEYFDTLEKEYDIKDYEIDIKRRSKKFPKEFKSDLWWKERGL